MPTRVVLITGASSGIGQACAEMMSVRGFQVFGSSRHPDFRPQTFRPVHMDVTDDVSVARAVSKLLEEVGSIDILINNAGCGLAGATEDTSTEEALHQMNVNFMGSFRVTRAVLPAMRERHSGVIINISSLGGIFGLPFQGFYSASKFAVEGWSESLQHEVRGFGIRVALVEPGDVRTGFTSGRVVVAANSSSAYGVLSAKCLQVIEKEEKQGIDPRIVAHLVCRVADGRAKSLRYTCGHLSQRIAVPVKRILPARIFQRIIASFYGLGGKA